MRAILNILGQDKPGIIAQVATALYECNANILDINQTVLQNEIFAMTMLVDVTDSTVSFGEIKQKLDNVSKSIGMEVKFQREEIFKSMFQV